MSEKLDELLRLIATVEAETSAWHNAQGFSCTRCNSFCALYPEGFCRCCSDAFHAAALTGGDDARP